MLLMGCIPRKETHTFGAFCLVRLWDDIGIRSGAEAGDDSAQVLASWVESAFNYPAVGVIFEKFWTAATLIRGRRAGDHKAIGKRDGEELSSCTCTSVWLAQWSNVYSISITICADDGYQSGTTSSKRFLTGNKPGDYQLICNGCLTSNSFSLVNDGLLPS